MLKIMILYLVTRYKNFLIHKELQIKMSFSIKRSVIESFNFNSKHVRSAYVKDVGQCLVSKDIHEAIGYDKENGVKAIQ